MHRHSPAIFHRRRGITRNVRSRDHFCLIQSQKNRRSLATFNRREIVHHGDSKIINNNRYFSGSSRNRRCNHRDSRGFAALFRVMDGDMDCSGGGCGLLQQSKPEMLRLWKLADCLLCLQGSVSRQHQGELMQFAWLQFSHVFDLVEAKHEGAVCSHLTGPW